MILDHTGVTMSSTKVAITLDEQLLIRVDRLVAERRFPNRSQAIQEAVREKIERMDRNRLARECAKLDPAYEKQLADEGLAEDLAEWPRF
jgi:metal-responsive CopG/Arc/MetJ family transcriptional regulator